MAAQSFSLGLEVENGSFSHGLFPASAANEITGFAGTLDRAGYYL